MNLDRNANTPTRLRRNAQRTRAGDLTGSVKITAPLTNAGSIALSLSTTGGLQTVANALSLKLADNSLQLAAGGASVKVDGTTVLSTAGGLTAVGTAPKNRLLNGRFDFWQRGTSLSAASGYLADRWRTTFTAAAGTSVSQQAFAAGQTAVPGNPIFFQRFAQTAANAWTVEQRTEDVTQLSGQTVTISFYANFNNGATVTTNIQQNFGSGGSATVNTAGASITGAGAWTKYTVTIAVPSVSGKTIGASSFTSFQLAGSAAITFDLSTVQLETGSVANVFEVRPLTTELLLCQRYYERSYALSQANGTVSALGPAIMPNTISSLAASTAGNVGDGTFLGFKTEKRVAPTIVLYAFDGTANGTHVDVPTTSVSGERYGATVGPVNAAGALQFVTYDATGTLVISKGACVFAHWTADAEL